MLGTSFDELIRHHPALRKDVMGILSEVCFLFFGVFIFYVLIRSLKNCFNLLLAKINVFLGVWERLLLKMILLSMFCLVIIWQLWEVVFVFFLKENPMGSFSYD